MEYGHEQAVADGVNVNYDVYRIRTQVSEAGGQVDAGYYVDLRDKLTRKVRWEQLGKFTAPAKQFANSKSNLRLVDGEEFVDLVLQKYDQLDSRYKGLIPLKRVWIPEPAGEGEG